jgi:hypothetical protein
MLELKPEAASLKLQAASVKLQASSFSNFKLQAPSCSRNKQQAASPEHKGSSFKPQAASSSICCPS